jgi:hypothetical protein
MKNKVLVLFMVILISLSLNSQVYAYNLIEEEYVNEDFSQFISDEEMAKIDREIAEFETSQIQDYTQPILFGVGYNGFNYLDGDILVTHSTSSNGLTGHVGIVSGNGVIHISPQYNNGHPELISIKEWFSRCPSTMVIRYKGDRSVPVNASWYGKTFYIEGRGNDRTYRITTTLDNQKYEYCSGLVWKCYKNGANFKFLVKKPIPPHYTEEMVVTPTFIQPYEFINNRVLNNFSAVHKVNWTL